MTNIVNLESKDLRQIQQLLQGHGLPYEDCHEHLDNFVGIFIEENLVAVGGFEHLGTVGLLRSIAVATCQQGKGFASQIVNRLEQNASILGLQAFYLLTETAEQYFLSRDYKTVGRNELPAEVTATKQCQSLCPASAQALFIHLPIDQS